MTDDHPEYNATVTDIRLVHDDLMIMRVEPDDAPLNYEPGQYTTLGLLTDERRIGETIHPDDPRHQLIRRAYSISCPILDDDGQLVARNTRRLEFYIALVRKDSDFPASLTPRIFAMEAGHRIFVGMQAKGTYTLDPVQPDRDVLFFATGTGEAPHNAMIRELLERQHPGHIASFVCVRHKRDLAYLETHRELEKRFPNYRYVALTTRDLENTDSNHPNYVGKQYLQQLFLKREARSPDELPPGISKRSVHGVRLSLSTTPKNRLQQILGWVPDPTTAHAFLCGNPAMIGAPKRDADGDHSFPDPKGMIETLVEQGFRLDRPHDVGNIHYERYW